MDKTTGILKKFHCGENLLKDPILKRKCTISAIRTAVRKEIPCLFDHHE